MKSKLLRGLIVVVGGYLLLVAIHFLYLTLGGAPSLHGDNAAAYETSKISMLNMARAEYSVRNYATVQYRAQGGSAVDQKYEKIGTLDAVSSEFEQDEKATRETVQRFRGIIQEEAVNSSDGFRSLGLTIGVPPDEFEGAVAALQKIGHLESFTVTKNDKTNDYLQLRAKRVSLEKTRDALIALKERGGNLDELVKLEREILDLESKIQDLGVQLGQFDEVNELCTIRFNLQERLISPRTYPNFGNLLASIEWAAKVYLALLAAAAIGLICLVLALVVAEKTKAILASSDERKLR